MELHQSVSLYPAHFRYRNGVSVYFWAAGRRSILSPQSPVFNFYRDRIRDYFSVRAESAYGSEQCLVLPCDPVLVRYPQKAVRQADDPTACFFYAE
ncbi:hypothetical protein D3C86_1822470 [compost metagenome]